MIGENLTLGLIVGAALADSINPCVFGVLIFLLLFMTKVFKNKNRMLLGGILYSLVVYITYLALGFGILKIAVSVGFANTFYWVAALIAILAGIIEIKDFFWYGKGFTLQMFPGASKRLKFYTNKIALIQKKSPSLSLIFIAFLGIFVVLVELPCTGAPYFAILALLAKGSYAKAVPYLLLYNFIFIVPLFVIIAIAYFGHGKSLQSWKEKHKGLMRLVIGTFLIGLGIFMIYSVTSF